MNDTLPTAIIYNLKDEAIKRRDVWLTEWLALKATYLAKGGDTEEGNKSAVVKAMVPKLNNLMGKYHHTVAVIEHYELVEDVQKQLSRMDQQEAVVGTPPPITLNFVTGTTPVHPE